MPHPFHIRVTHNKWQTQIWGILTYHVLMIGAIPFRLHPLHIRGTHNNSIMFYNIYIPPSKLHKKDPQCRMFYSGKFLFLLYNNIIVFNLTRYYQVYYCSTVVPPPTQFNCTTGSTRKCSKYYCKNRDKKRYVPFNFCSTYNSATKTKQFSIHSQF